MSLTALENDQALKLNTILDVVLPLVATIYRNMESSLEIIQIPTSLQESLEFSGTELWNSTSSFASHLDAIYKVKLYSILLLIVYETLNPNVDRCLTNISCLLNLYSGAITNAINDVSDKCNIYLEPMIGKLMGINKDMPLKDQKRQLLNEYYHKLTILNLNYAAINNNFVLARNYESKLSSYKNLSDPFFLGECSRVLYNHCLQLYEHSDFENAKFLILIAIKHLESNTMDSLFFQEKYFNCYVLLIKTYKSIGTPETQRNIKKAFSHMQHQFPNKFEMYCLYFEICDDAEEVETEDVLMRLVTSVDTAAYFEKTVDLLKLNVNKCFRGVNKCIDYLLAHINSNPSFSETLITTKFVVNVLLNTSKDSEETLKELQLFLQFAEKSLQKQLSGTTKTSIVAIIWSQGIKFYKQAEYIESLEWLKIALSRLFYTDYKENQDRGKVLRVIQNNYFLLGEYNQVISTASQMDPEDKNAPLTQFNLFRANLMLGNEKLALECIDKILSNDDSLTVLTIAVCILESKGKLPLEAIRSIFLKLVEHICEMELTKESISKLESHNVVLPTCCRCAVVMYLTELENGGNLSESTLHSLKELLENSCAIAKKIASTQIHIFTIDDLEWLASKSYNIAMSCQNGELNSFVGLFYKICIAFIDLISPDIEAERGEQLILWKVRATIFGILNTCLDCSLGASEWISIREKCLELKGVVYKQNDTDSNWKECLQQIIAIHFQAELSLGSSQSLHDIVLECKGFKPAVCNDMYDLFIQLITDSKRQISNQKRKQLIGLVISQAIKNIEPSQVKNIITWMRLLMEVSGHNFSSEEEVLMLQLYRLIKANRNEITIPTFEMEWLATKSWNHGIYLLMYVFCIY